MNTNSTVSHQSKVLHSIVDFASYSTVDSKLKLREKNYLQTVENGAKMVWRREPKTEFFMTRIEQNLCLVDRLKIRMKFFKQNILHSLLC